MSLLDDVAGGEQRDRDGPADGLLESAWVAGANAVQAELAIALVSKIRAPGICVLFYQELDSEG